MFKFNSTRVVSLAIAAVTALGFPIADVAMAAPVSSGTSSKVGSGCTVTAGNNKGKTGTYENFEGDLYCSGSGWSTGCNPTSGGSRCKDAALIGPVTRLPIYSPGSFSFMR